MPSERSYHPPRCVSLFHLFGTLFVLTVIRNGLLHAAIQGCPKGTVLHHDPATDQKNSFKFRQLELTMNRKGSYIIQTIELQSLTQPSQNILGTTICRSGQLSFGRGVGTNVLECLVTKFGSKRSIAMRGLLTTTLSHPGENYASIR